MNRILSKKCASDWDEALPLGNGILGALVYGGVAEEYVVFNHENLYLPFDNDFQLGENKEFVSLIKKEVSEGNYKKAENLLAEKYDAAKKTPPYQPLCELTITTDIKGEKKNYMRVLDLKKAEATISWEADGTVYKRRQFISKNENQFIMEITNSQNKKMTSTISLNARLESEPTQAKEILKHIDTKFTINHELAGDTIYFSGIYKEGGEFGGIMKLVTDGRLSVKKDYENYDTIYCADYTYAVIYVTGYAYCEKIFPVIKPYDELFSESLKIYSELYNRVKVDFGYKTDKCTEELILKASYDNPDPAMYELMFNYSRYLFISCAINCKYPPNLQGIWNGSYTPPWQCDFHNDENIQLCLWQALSLGMPEAVEVYMDYYSSFMDDYRQNARYYFDADGIALPMGQTVSGKALRTGMWNMFPGLAGWVAQLYYNYYHYCEDKDILKEKIYPFLKEVAEFYISFCTEKDGVCQFIPSMSPENEPVIHGTENDPDKKTSIVSVNSTYDVAVAKEVFTNIISVCKILGYDYKCYEEMLSKMPEYKINEDGAIKEWLNDELCDNYEHRHLSHIYPLFPGSEINKFNNEKMYNALKIATEKRMTVGITSQSGWSLTHMAHIYARLNDGENALQCLRMLMRTSLLNNLFTLHNDRLPSGNSLYWWSISPFQIDANLGFASALAEMFLYSSNDYIKIAPAVPELLKNAKFKGLCAKGNIKVDIEMKDGFAHVILYSQKRKNITIEINGEIKDIVLNKGANVIS